ncbi:hypothetical protein K1T71_000641 [Dendrolimus kikuchii]|uniref:Uncharacterized protein n=1 Tax=Dendrolimus kikuchii TaxID=765133 RepID=A0ACC1DJU1_9NEOP|nr:hypothetical protein K1T71_000641 [Dendrolimus kikuchii]
MSRIPRSPPQKYDTNMQHTLSDSDVAKIAPCTSIQLPVAKRPRKQAKNNSDEEFAVFKDDIKCMLEDWKNTQNSLLNKLIHEVADIKDQNNQIKQSNEEIEKSLDFLNLQYEDIKLKVQGLETERKEYLQHITFLETKIEDMERNAKLSSIEIRNVPLINKAETKTDLCNIVQNTCKALNVIVPQVAIRDVYRLNKKNTKSSTIIADFTSVILKNEVIQGVVRGLLSENGNVSRFLGIPYALVDEENPFAPARPHPGFTEPYDAHSDHIICPQVNMEGNGDGEFQCLRLHIYVPNTPTTNKAVLVWIYGGAFVTGNGGSELYAPTYLVNKDVIFVAINYRVGIYGFLCLDTPEVPGNQGFKDQKLALRWIKNNIEAFGGDPNKITLFGESAGGMSVNLHLINNDEKLIVESTKTIPIIIANELGYNNDDLLGAMAFLSAQDPAVVTVKSQELLFTSPFNSNPPIVKPCVEKMFKGVDNFLVDYPLNIKSSLIQSTPVMIGFNDNEMLFQYGIRPAEFFENYSFDTTLSLGMTPLNESVVGILRNFYIGDEPLSNDLRNLLTDFSSHFAFGYQTERQIRQFIEQEASDVYYYVFSYDGNRNFNKIIMNMTAEGASHADELGYLFDMRMFLDAKNERDMLMVEKITTLWTNFAKYGTPTPSATDLLPFIWPKVTDKTRPYLVLDSELEIKNRPFSKRFAFWDLFYKINERCQVGYGYVPQYGRK